MIVRNSPISLYLNNVKTPKISPHTYFNDCPCIKVSCISAVVDIWKSDDYILEMLTKHDNLIRKDGYTTLKNANTIIRDLFIIRYYKYYKKEERKTLKEILPTLIDGEHYIICCLGHYIYAKKNEYCSFFDNNDDEVVALWKIH